MMITLEITNLQGERIPSEGTLTCNWKGEGSNFSLDTTILPASTSLTMNFDDEDEVKSAIHHGGQYSVKKAGGNDDNGIYKITGRAHGERRKFIPEIKRERTKDSSDHYQFTRINFANYKF